MVCPGEAGHSAGEEDAARVSPPQAAYFQKEDVLYRKIEDIIKK